MISIIDLRSDKKFDQRIIQEQNTIIIKSKNIQKKKIHNIKKFLQDADIIMLQETNLRGSRERRLFVSEFSETKLNSL